MKSILFVCAAAVVVICSSFFGHHEKRKIFDVHIHGNKSKRDQLQALEKAGVYKACISTSWTLQEEYRQERSLICYMD
jgi:hypothetical protein